MLAKFTSLDINSSSTQIEVTKFDMVRALYEKTVSWAGVFESLERSCYVGIA